MSVNMNHIHNTSRRPLLTHVCFVVNDSDADVSFRSVDGVVFRLHKVNLSVTTGGFPLDFIRGPMRDEYLYVDLAETADTLELLFGFVYPRMHKTNIGIMDFDTLAALASAAEKYQVFVAMDVCQVRMAYVPIPQNCATVLTYVKRAGPATSY